MVTLGWLQSLIGPKHSNIDTYIKQFVDEQIFCYMQHTLEPLHLNCNLSKLKEAKDE